MPSKLAKFKRKGPLKVNAEGFDEEGARQEAEFNRDPEAFLRKSAEDEAEKRRSSGITAGGTKFVGRRNGELIYTHYPEGWPFFGHPKTVTVPDTGPAGLVPPGKKPLGPQPVNSPFPSGGDLQFNNPQIPNLDTPRFSGLAEGSTPLDREGIAQAVGGPTPERAGQPSPFIPAEEQLDAINQKIMNSFGADAQAARDARDVALDELRKQATERQAAIAQLENTSEEDFAPRQPVPPLFVPGTGSIFAAAILGPGEVQRQGQAIMQSQQLAQQVMANNQKQEGLYKLRQMQLGQSIVDLKMANLDRELATKQSIANLELQASQAKEAGKRSFYQNKANDIKQQMAQARENVREFQNTFLVNFTGEASAQLDAKLAEVRGMGDIQAVDEVFRFLQEDIAQMLDQATMSVDVAGILPEAEAELMKSARNHTTAMLLRHALRGLNTVAGNEPARLAGGGLPGVVSRETPFDPGIAETRQLGAAGGTLDEINALNALRRSGAARNVEPPGQGALDAETLKRREFNTRLSNLHSLLNSVTTPGVGNPVAAITEGAGTAREYQTFLDAVQESNNQVEDPIDKVARSIKAEPEAVSKAKQTQLGGVGKRIQSNINRGFGRDRRRPSTSATPGERQMNQDLKTFRKLVSNRKFGGVGANPDKAREIYIRTIQPALDRGELDIQDIMSMTGMVPRALEAFLGIKVE